MICACLGVEKDYHRATGVSLFAIQQFLRNVKEYQGGTERIKK